MAQPVETSEPGFWAQFSAQWKTERFTRLRVHQILSTSRTPHDKVSKVADYFLIALIVLNVLAVMLESVPAIGNAWMSQFFVFEGVSVFFFTAEYLARIWTAVENPRYADKGPVWGRVRYAFSPIALTDLVAIIPFYLVLSGTNFVDLRFLRIMRLRRAFKLTRYSPDMSIVLGVLRDELRLLLALAFVILLLMVMGASTIFAIEGAETGPFSSIPGAMQWALTNLTTLGNAEVQPDSAFGRSFGMILGIVGVIVVAMISGIFASGFTNARMKRHASLRRFMRLQLVLSGGVLTPVAETSINAQRRHLGFSEADGLEILNEVLEEQAAFDPDALRALVQRDDRMLTDE